jgi:hypothetical protein
MSLFNKELLTLANALDAFVQHVCKKVGVSPLSIKLPLESFINNALAGAVDFLA